MNQRLIAIWKYDLPPFYLAGEVESIEGDYVKVKNYNGMMFKPIKIYSYDEGMIIAEKLKELKNQYKEGISNLMKEVENATNNLLFKE